LVKAESFEAKFAEAKTTLARVTAIRSQHPPRTGAVIEPPVHVDRQDGQEDSGLTPEPLAAVLEADAAALAHDGTAGAVRGFSPHLQQRTSKQLLHRPQK
jgi:hypothetical protein